MNKSRVGRPPIIDPEVVSLVAVRLFDEKGYDAVSMDDVAASTSVSRRSLFRLFPTKASLVWGGLDEFTDRLLQSLDDSSENLFTATLLSQAYRRAATFPPNSIEITRRRLRVIAANPELAAEGVLRVADVTGEVARFIAARDETTSDGLRATIAAAALASAASAALTWWALRSDDAPEDAVARAIDLVLAAVP